MKNKPTATQITQLSPEVLHFTPSSGAVIPDRGRETVSHWVHVGQVCGSALDNTMTSTIYVYCMQDNWTVFNHWGGDHNPIF